jgi:hypothetical protein
VVGSASTSSYGIDTNWYTDSGATDHITGELEKMAIREKYKGQEQVHNTNGAGMEISHIGQSFIRTPHKNLKVKNILHVPSTSKNLLSVHRLTLDNNIFIEFHPWFFLIKDQVTKKVLFRGRCRRGLYPLVPQDWRSIKQAFNVTKIPSSRWHSRLGHPFFLTVQRVLRNNKL